MTLPTVLITGTLTDTLAVPVGDVTVTFTPIIPDPSADPAGGGIILPQPIVGVVPSTGTNAGVLMSADQAQTGVTVPVLTSIHPDAVYRVDAASNDALDPAVTVLSWAAVSQRTSLDGGPSWQATGIIDAAAGVTLADVEWNVTAPATVGPQLTDLTKRTLSTIIGGAVVVDDTPPPSATYFGKPVVWIDTSAALQPIGTAAAPPIWDNLNLKYTLPSGGVGYHYVVNGVTQGAATYDVPDTGTWPRIVTVTAEADTGYAVTGAHTWVHYYANPDALVLLGSDTFTGAATTNIYGRTFNNAAGGSTTSPLTWVGPSWLGTTYGLKIASGAAEFTRDGNQSSGVTLAGRTVNPKIEFDLTYDGTTSEAGGIHLYIRSGNGAHVELLISDANTYMGAYDGSDMTGTDYRNADSPWGFGAGGARTQHVVVSWYYTNYTVQIGSWVRTIELPSTAPHLSSSDGYLWIVTPGSTSTPAGRIDNLKIYDLGGS